MGEESANLSVWWIYTIVNGLLVTWAALYCLVSKGPSDDKSFRTFVPQFFIAATLISSGAGAAFLIFAYAPDKDDKDAKEPSSSASVVVHVYAQEKTCSQCPGDESEQSATVYFEFEETEIGALIQNRSLADFARAVPECCGCSMSVYGHADQLGPERTNQCFGARRALALYDEISMGREDIPVRLYTCGADAPVFDRSERVRKTETVNRRASVYLTCGGQTPVEAASCKEFKIVGDGEGRTMTFPTSGESVCAD